MSNKIIPYDRHLKMLARDLRKNMTPSERIIWEHIRRRALGVEFHRQVPILHYIVDFYCHEIGLVLEIDGSVHEHNFLKDAERQGKMEKHGLHFLRFSNEQIACNLDGVLETIKIYLKDLDLRKNVDPNSGPSL